MAFEGKHSDLTNIILKAFYNVYNRLGYGFSEKIYERATVIELRKSGIKVDQQRSLKIYYDSQLIREQVIDLLVEEAVILELKAVKQLADEHKAQLLNYLKASKIEVGLLLNFGQKAEFVRQVYDNSRKGSLTWMRPDG